MKACVVLLAAMLVAGCASLPMPPPERLFDDRLFAAPSQPIRAENVFALSPPMKAYLETEIAANVRSRGPQNGLFAALYSRGQLKLEYETTITRNAAQTFAARAGNCLSLVIMTGAFAKQMGVPVRYQQLYVDDTWSRSDDLYVSSGHVNLTLSTRLDPFARGSQGDTLTIDFLPPADIRGYRTRTIEEHTVVAMYLNNRAAESLAARALDDAYWFARAAIGQDPALTSAYNTLGIIYKRHGDLAQAETAFRYTLAQEPRNASALSNLAAVLTAQGRAVEADEIAQRLAQIEPDPPFSFFNRGMAAMRMGDYRTAKELFAKEVERAPYYHEFHFWLGAAYIGLGEFQRGRDEIALAVATSPTPGDRDIYAAKLEKLNARLH